LEPTADGFTNTIIPVLCQGRVTLSVLALFRDNALSSKQFALNVTPPVDKPEAFVADRSLRNGDHQLPIRLHVGQWIALEPAVGFTTAPRPIILAPSTFTVHVVPQAGTPVVAVDPAGKITALHEGSATVQVVFGKFTADQPIIVKS
jgi:hypothetical protein